MTKIVYAKVKGKLSEVYTYFAGPNLNAIRNDLINWDNASTLEQISEAEARKLSFFYKATNSAKKGWVFDMGNENSIDMIRYGYLFFTDTCHRN